MLTSFTTLLLLVSVAELLLFGDSDFGKVVMTGPYEVGFKEFRTTKLDNEVSVFYPISRTHHSELIKDHNTEWFRHGDKTLLGIAKASLPYGNTRHPPLFFFRFMRKIVMDTVLDVGHVDSDFHRKSLIPIIFCHGLSSNRTMHSGTARDFASHGYIVFSLDHKDESASYYENIDGTGYWY